MATDDRLEIVELIERVELEGEVVGEVEDWRAEGVEALLLTSQSGARFLIEAQDDRPSLVTRLSEREPLLGYAGPRIPVAIVRYEGNPDRNLHVGRSVSILGLSRTHEKFDPDSIYATTPLVEIRLLRSEETTN